MKVVENQREGLGEALHILSSGNEEVLLAHVLNDEHTCIAEIMIYLTLRE